MVSLAEPVARHIQRLYALVDLTPLGAMLAGKVKEAEEAIYADPHDPLVNWAEEDLRLAFEAAGFGEVKVEAQATMVETRITPALLTRWFTPTAPGDRPAYSQRLAARLTPDELAAVQALYARTLTGQVVPWRSVMAYLAARQRET
ncbi:MAG: hypothetical protein NT169_09770 [Chloroflexi bacterium]|nr:hypothetical protein [Chloroflexota bacterium]